MAIKVEWFNEEHTVLRWIFEEGWTWGDYTTTQDEVNVILEPLDYTVDIIGDLTNSPALPLNALTAYRSLVDRTAEHVGTIVLVGASTFVKTMIRVFKTFFAKKVPGTDFAFAGTVEEAYAMILEQQQARQQGQE